MYENPSKIWGMRVKFMKIQGLQKQRVVKKANKLGTNLKMKNLNQ